MSDTKNEPLAAILAQLRRWAKQGLAINPGYIADRIERAAELERIELREDEAKMLLREYAAAPDESLTPSALELKRELLRLASAPGNAAAMRDVLESANRTLKLVFEHAGEFVQPRLAEEIIHSGAAVERALSEPARNCDVGTAEEQAERHKRFCAAHYKADAVDAQCFGCPASDKKETDCEFVWGQLPFAPAEGGAE